MITFRLKIDRTLLSLSRFRATYPLAMRRAVRRGAGAGVRNIVSNNPVDTGRLRAGWSGAGAELGVGVPAQERFPDPSYYGAPPRGRDFSQFPWSEIVGPNQVTFIARNNVPYGVEVEARRPFVLLGLESARSEFEAAVVSEWNGLK